MEKNIEKMRKEFGNGLEKYLTKNDHMKEMSKKDLLDWIFTEYVVNHKLEGVEALLGLTQSYEKGNVFDFDRAKVKEVIEKIVEEPDEFYNESEAK